MRQTLPQFPVFAFPNSLKFYVGTKSTHTQVLSIYSPYDFPIKYKVHCHSSAWDKYIVPAPEGTIPGQSSVDLVITHKQVTLANCNVVDRLKVVIQDSVTDKIIGKKTIDAILLPGERHSNYPEDDGHNSQEGSTTSRSVHNPQPTRLLQQQPATRSITEYPKNALVCLSVIVVCLVLLLLPVEFEPQRPSNVPSYLHVSHKVQLLAALILGVFLCILIRTS